MILNQASIRSHLKNYLPQKIRVYLGSSTEIVAFQVYEILEIDHEFLQFFWLGSKI